LIGATVLILGRTEPPKMNLSAVGLYKTAQEQLPQHEEFSSLFRSSDVSASVAWGVSFAVTFGVSLACFSWFWFSVSVFMTISSYGKS